MRMPRGHGKTRSGGVRLGHVSSPSSESSLRKRRSLVETNTSCPSARNPEQHRTDHADRISERATHSLRGGNCALALNVAVRFRFRRPIRAVSARCGNSGTEGGVPLYGPCSPRLQSGSRRPRLHVCGRNSQRRRSALAKSDARSLRRSAAVGN